MIYNEVFTGSCVTVVASSMSSVPHLKATDHNRLLLTCHRVYEEARTAYWSRTAVCGTDAVRLGAVLLSIPSHARPLIEDMRFNPHQGSRMGACEFLGHFKRLRTIVLTAPSYVEGHVLPHRNYPNWLAIVATLVQREVPLPSDMITWCVSRGIAVLERLRGWGITNNDFFVNYATGEVFETDRRAKDEEGFLKVCKMHRPAQWLERK